VIVSGAIFMTVHRHIARGVALNPDVSPSRPITASISSSSPGSAVFDPSVTAMRG
jgi:hypothetical protein